MKQRYLITLAVLFFILANAKGFAQQRSITGSIIDFSGNAMPGVNVIVIGTPSGTVTDATGQYIITVPEGSNTLLFSFVGFVTQEVVINNRTVVDVALVEDIKQPGRSCCNCP